MMKNYLVIIALLAPQLMWCMETPGDRGKDLLDLTSETPAPVPVQCSINSSLFQQWLDFKKDCAQKEHQRAVAAHDLELEKLKFQKEQAIGDDQQDNKKFKLERDSFELEEKSAKNRAKRAERDFDLKEKELASVIAGRQRDRLFGFAGALTTAGLGVLGTWLALS